MCAEFRLAQNSTRDVTLAMFVLNSDLRNIQLALCTEFRLAQNSTRVVY